MNNKTLQVRPLGVPPHGKAAAVRARNYELHRPPESEMSKFSH